MVIIDIGSILRHCLTPDHLLSALHRRMSLKVEFERFLFRLGSVTTMTLNPRHFVLSSIVFLIGCHLSSSAFAVEFSMLK